MDDLGMDSQRLVSLKRLIYLEGIGGNLSAWGQLDAGKRLEGFAHSFAMRLHGEAVIGRFWSSSDGTGRRIYPMMVMADCVGCDLSWVMNEAFSALAELQEKYQAATTAEEVRTLTDEARQRLRESAGGASAGGPRFGHVLTWLSQRPEMGKDQRGLLNLMYEAQERLSVFARQTDGNRTTIRSGASFPLRLPTCGQSPADAIRLWLEFFDVWLDEATPMLAIVAEAGGWVDLIIGDAAPSDLYCLQASPKTIPFNTEIPYNFDGAFATRARRMISDETTGGSNT